MGRMKERLRVIELVEDLRFDESNRDFWAAMEGTREDFRVIYFALLSCDSNEDVLSMPALKRLPILEDLLKQELVGGV